MPSGATASAAHVGRFAPSPTGPLHFGSLVAAVASHADARHQGGTWLVRIEDVDETRRRPGADRDILETLERFGMTPDREVVWQSDRKALYRDALDRLLRDARAFPCVCSRADVASVGRTGPEGPVYPGTCRRSPPAGDPASVALRAVADGAPVEFVDRVVGPVRQDVARDIGDFVIRRADGFTAYQLAVVVDDAEQGVTDVVRGADLLWSTPRQILLQQALGLARPAYAHVPLVLGSDGRKLSKQDAAHPVGADDPLPALRAAWQFLGQEAPPAGIGTSAEFWSWAVPRWRIGHVPREAVDKR